MRSFLVGGLGGSLAIWLALQTAVLAASGTAVGVDPQAEALLASQKRVLVVGADVSIGEKIVTGPKGLVQIKFADTTELVVGPNSALVIEDYLVRNDNSAGKLAINALTGTFRFATGVSAKDRYVIKTPTGTIGVRGTAFDFEIDDERKTHVIVFHGAVRMCNLAGTCVTLDGSCTVGTYDMADAQVLGQSTGFDRATRNAMRDQFPYADNESALLRSFWVAEARACLNQSVSITPSTGLSSSSPDPNYVAPPDDPHQCHGGKD